MANNEQDIFLVKQVLSPEVLSLLTDYSLCKARTKPQRCKNAFLKNVHREYADPFMEILLQRLTPVVESAVGSSLWPTLSFYYTYKQGQALPPHRDRSSCEIVAGLCIGADEAFKVNHGSWPLCLKLNGKSVSYEVQYGDLLIFRGHTTEHWREPFAGDWFVSAIFGFVEKTGSFAFQKYDQRAALGLPHVGMFVWTWGALKHRVNTCLKKIYLRSRARKNSSDLSKVQ